jgi:hypothetical protein
MGDQPGARQQPTYGTTQTQNKRAQTSMSEVGFEPTNPVFDWAKTVRSLDRAATAIGRIAHIACYFGSDPTENTAYTIPLFLHANWCCYDLMSPTVA